MNTAIWARLTLRSGQNPVPSPQPAVTPSSAMRSMNRACQPATSSNLDSETGAGSLPSRMRTTHTAIVLRSIGLPGQKPASQWVPKNTPRSASVATGSE